MAQVIASKCKALSSNPRTTKKKKGKIPHTKQKEREKNGFQNVDILENNALNSLLLSVFHKD
jgi:hypothetical protein